MVRSACLLRHGVFSVACPTTRSFAALARRTAIIGVALTLSSAGCTKASQGSTPGTIAGPTYQRCGPSTSVLPYTALPAAPTATGAPPSRSIGYSSDPGGLMMMDTAGHSSQLLSSVGLHGLPLWTPDGLKAVSVGRDAGVGNGGAVRFTSDVKLRFSSADPSDPPKTIDAGVGEVTSFSVSNDVVIAVVSNGDVRAYPLAEGSVPRTLVPARGELIGILAVSPDSAKVAVTSVGVKRKLYVLSTAMSVPQLPPPLVDVNVGFAAWDHAGTIAFTGEDEANQRTGLFTVGATDGGVRFLASVGSLISIPGAPSWSPDNSRIAYVVKDAAGANPSLCVFNLTTGEMKQWSAPGLSPSIRWADDSNWVLSVSGGNAKDVTFNALNASTGESTVVGTIAASPKTAASGDISSVAWVG